MRTIRMRTNAKVNLFLRVMGARPDGYHEIETILHGVGLADDVTVVETTTGEIEIDMRLEDITYEDAPSLTDNAMFHAAQQLLSRGAINKGIRIDLTKRIPIGAGLGGGSGNAAGALFALNELWGTDLRSAELQKVAEAVGSDVPYCILGGTALATSRGEELTSLPAPIEMWFVLGISHSALLTRDVYADWRAGESTSDVGSAPMTMALGGSDVDEIASLLHNDFEPTVFRLRPELEKRKHAFLDAEALGACVSGSGPTIFAIGRDRSHAYSIAERVRDQFDDVRVVRSQSVCIERLD